MMANFALCIGAVVVICLFVLHQLPVVVLTALLITMIDIDLVGSIHWWGEFSRSMTTMRGHIFAFDRVV
eukprot:SAG11_NODE_23704_length_384_cov_0.901754_1_plen_69_part_00